MPKRISEITDSLRQLAEIQVTDWDFMGLLNKDLKDLEIGSSLRKLGNKKVMNWDFKTVLPAVHKFAHQDIDLVGWVKRAADFKVMEWDFRSGLADGGEPPGQEEMQELSLRLKGFLHFVTVSLIDETGRAQIRIQEISPGVLRFRLVVAQKDLKTMLGRDGATASAIRNLLKASAAAEGVKAFVEILSSEEELARNRRGEE